MNKLYFSDSIVENFFNDKATVVLEARDIKYEGELVKAKYTVEGVTSIQKVQGDENSDYENLEVLEMLSKDGEILNVHSRADGIDIIIQWNFYNPVKLLTSAYRILGKNVNVDLSEPYLDER